MNMFVVDSNFIVYSRLAIVKHRIRYCFDIDEARIHYLNTLGPILLMHTSIIIGIYEIWTISPISLETLETLLLGNTIHFVHKSFRKTMTYLAIYGSSPPSFIISYCDTFGVATVVTCNSKTVFTGVMEHQRPVWRSQEIYSKDLTKLRNLEKTFYNFHVAYTLERPILGVAAQHAKCKAIQKL